MIAASLARCMPRLAKPRTLATYIGPHAVRPGPEAPRLARAPSRHAGSRPADRRLLRRSPRIVGCGASARCSATMLDEQDVDIMAWAHRNRRAAGALRRADDRGAEEARLHPGGADERAAAARPRAPTEPLTLAGVPTGFLPWLAADLARAAHGSGKGGRAVVIAADEAAMRALADTVAAVRARGRGADLPGLGLPALRPRLAGAAGDGRAAGDAERAAGASATGRSCWSPPPTPRPSALLTPVPRSAS